MRPDGPARTPGQGSLVEALLADFAQRVAAELALLMGAPPARYATAKDNPFGAARPFLDAARRGDFESFKRGRNVAARWEDVEKYVESRKRPARHAAPGGLEDDRALLAAHGVRLRRPGSR